jgi:putative heme utilization carrier protein HutX
MPRVSLTVSILAIAWMGPRAIAVATAQEAAAPVAVCASAAQVQAVRDRIAANPKFQPAALSGELQLSEAAVVGALPPGRSTGVSGRHFHEIWRSLQGWDDAVFIVRKAGNVFEIHGRVHGGEPSKVSKYFNLADGAGVSGHLRPDLVSAIYAASLPGREGDEHGVLFYDEAGGLAFEVYVPATSKDPKAGVLAQFLATQAQMEKLPRLCM